MLAEIYAFASYTVHLQAKLCNKKWDKGTFQSDVSDVFIHATWLFITVYVTMCWEYKDSRHIILVC